MKYTIFFGFTFILFLNGCRNNNLNDINITNTLLNEWKIKNLSSIKECCDSEENRLLVIHLVEKIHNLRISCFDELKNNYPNEIIRREIEISEDYSEHSFDYYFKLRIDKNKTLGIKYNLSDKKYALIKNLIENEWDSICNKMESEKTYNCCNYLKEESEYSHLATYLNIRVSKTNSNLQIDKTCIFLQ